MKVEFEGDIASNPGYLENKFVTEDGFQVGYYVSEGKNRWYLKLEKYGSDDTIFVADGSALEVAFANAKSKIDELMKL